MSFKNAWNALVGNSNTTEIVAKKDAPLDPVASEAFPVVHIEPNQLAAYKQIPLASLASLGTAFSQLPEGARTVVQTITKNVATQENLFVGVNPKGIQGFLRADANGTVGNILQINSQGKEIIAGRMRFKPIDQLPIQESLSTVMPIDPMLMVVAIALMTIEKKLDGIQKSVEEVLQFLKLEKQSVQRGNLNMLAEIMDEYKLNCKNEQFCLSRSQAILTIKKDAHRDILFYQEQISAELQKQKTLHIGKDAQHLLDSVSYQFAEYQLACHLYAYSSFLDVMIQRTFDTNILQGATEKMITMAKRYQALYADCHSQIAKYQRSSVESQIVGGIGIAAKGLGKAISSVPVIKDGPVDEALINAGNSIGKFNREVVKRKLESFETFETDRMAPFIENLQSIDIIYNKENSMITDGTNLYLLQSN